MLDPHLLDALACPVDHGPLLYFSKEAFLYNPRLKRRYAIEDGVPQMVPEEAQQVTDEEHSRLEKLAQTNGMRPNF